MTNYAKAFEALLKGLSIEALTNQIATREEWEKDRAEYTALWA